MGTTQQISEALSAEFEPGEHVIAWHRVAAATTDGRDFDAALALLGPSAYVATLSSAGAGARPVPDRTNLVVVTDRRMLWCAERRPGGAITVVGADPLTVLAAAAIAPGRRAPARLRVRFHDRSVVHFDLPPDHRIDEFIVEVTELLSRVRSAA